MDVALVEHAEDDVDGDEGGQDEQGSVASEAWKACAVPWKLPWMVAGMPMSRSRAVDGVDGVARGRRRARG